MNTAELNLKFLKERCLKDVPNHSFGCTLGAFLGDSIGSFVEFMSPQNNDKLNQALQMQGGGPFQLGAGQITDDSELALCLAYGLVDSKTMYNPQKIAKYYKFWVNSRPFDIGNTTRNAFSPYNDKNLAMNQQLNLDEIKKDMILPSPKIEKASQSNGVLMRLTPLSVFALKHSQEDLEKFTAKEVFQTHQNDLVVYSSIIYAMTLKMLILHPYNFHSIFESIENIIQTRFQDLSPWLESWPQEEGNIGNRQEAMVSMGHAKIAFRMSFTILKQLSQIQKKHIQQHGFLSTLSDQPGDSNLVGWLPEMGDLKSFYLDNIKRILSWGGDTDTNACIVGGMLGAIVGFNNLPSKQVEILLSCKTENGRKRPEIMSPQNIVSLVDQLLAQQGY